jgi:hypothetical protein
LLVRGRVVRAGVPVPGAHLAAFTVGTRGADGASPLGYAVDVSDAEGVFIMRVSCLEGETAYVLALTLDAGGVKVVVA